MDDDILLCKNFNVHYTLQRKITFLQLQNMFGQKNTKNTNIFQRNYAINPKYSFKLSNRRYRPSVAEVTSLLVHKTI